MINNFDGGFIAPFGVWSPGALRLGLSLKRVPDLIRDLFSASEPGLAWNLNDLTTLYQDAAGTVPVTAPGQSVALVLDKSKGLAIGPERVTNGSFSAGATGWAGINGTDEVVSGGVLNFTNAVAGNPNASQAGVITPSKSYRVTFRVTGRLSGAVYLQIYATNALNNMASPPVSSDGVHTAILHAPADATGLLGIRATTGATLGITDISVRELAGSHAYQTDSARRPLLQRDAATGAHYLLPDGVDDYLVTPAINFAPSQAVTVFAGVRKLSDAVVGTIAELSTDAYANAGTFYLGAPGSVGVGDFVFASRGTSPATVTATPYAAPISAVLTGQARIGPTPLTRLRVNGLVGYETAATQGTGGYGSHPVYIGRTAGASKPFGGRIYDLIILGREVTPTERAAVEESIANNVGVTV